MARMMANRSLGIAPGEPHEIDGMTDATVDRLELTAEPCALCHGAGFVRLNVPVGDPRFGKAMPCACKREEYRGRRLERLRRMSNLQHMSSIRFDTFHTKGHGSPDVWVSLTEALTSAKEFAATPAGWLVITGSYGCGKTHLAAAIANHRVERGLPVLFVVVPDLLDYLRTTYAPDSPTSFDERFEQVRNVELLVLDDFGTQHTTPWASEKLYQLLNYRYNAKLPTVITTNQTLDEMDPRLSSRFADRDLVRTLPIYAPDFRNKGRNDTFGSLAPYGRMTFASFSDRQGEIEPAQSAALRQITKVVEQFAEHPVNWLLLRGGHGAGKTHLAAALANKVLSSGRDVLFVVVPDLLDYLRATFQPGSPVSYDQRFNGVRRARLLVLDDIGTHSATPWAEEKLFQILNFRHIAGQPTVLTIANDCWDKLDERLKSRLLAHAMCTIIDLDVPPYRGAVPERKSPRRSTRRHEQA